MMNPDTPADLDDSQPVAGSSKVADHANVAPLRQMADAAAADLAKFLSVVPAKNRTCQTFDDKRLSSGKTRKDRSLACVLHGDLATHEAKLRRLNDPEAGAGVFITGNLTDGRGRKDRNITAIVALVADLDHGQIRPWPIEPTLVVETSPGKLQVWWLLTDALPREQQRAIMLPLVADYGADPAAVDVARVYRVPGFWHLKGEPFMVRIVGGTMQPVAAKDLIAAFPPMPTKVSVRAARSERRPAFSNRTGPVRLVEPLRAIPADDYHTWITVGMALHAETRGSEEGLALYDEWSNRSEKYQEGECATKWATFAPRDEARVTVGTIYFLAEQHGWTRSSRHAYRTTR